MEPRQSCFARMLDVRGYVLAARHATVNASAGSALLMIVLFGLISLCLLPVWIAFDLNSTWAFTTGLRDAAEPVITDASVQANIILGMSVGALLTGVIFTSFTLLPSLFELAFPTVAHPMLNVILLASIVFDFVTDWGKAWETSSAWTDTLAIHAIYAATFCVFVSVIVQALLAICLTVIIFSIIAILRGGNAGNRVVQGVLVDR